MRALKVLVVVMLVVAPAVLSDTVVHTQTAPQLTQSIDGIFKAWDKPTSPGCALAVIKDGRLVYTHAYGMANLDHDVPLTPASVFHVASVSKQFTAAAIVLLAQDGKLALQDDVRKYLPELPAFAQPITIRHLVHHTSGLRDQWELLGLAGWRYSLDLITSQDVLDVMSRQRDLNFVPGDQHLYCNTGYTLLATIVARVSKQSFREFTTARIFAPLGMTSTHFRDDHAEVVKGQAYGYVPAKGEGFRLSVTNFDTVGATSLLTTVEDLAKWDQNFYDPRVGGKSLIAQLLQPGTLNSGKTLDYAFGLVHGQYRGLPTVSHGGSDAGYRSHLLRFPEQRFSVACLCNLSTTNPADLVRKVADAYLTDQLGPEEGPASPVDVPPAQLSRFGGTYWNEDTDAFRRIVFAEGKLQLAEPESSDDLVPLSNTRFRVGDRPGYLELVETRPGAGWQLREMTPGADPVVFEPVEPFAPSADQLQDYTGTFVSDEIEPLYRFELEEGALRLKRLKSEPTTLEPMTRDVFRMSRGTVRFVRDGDGRISGWIYNGGRVRHFRFRKLIDQRK